MIRFARPPLPFIVAPLAILALIVGGYAWYAISPTASTSELDDAAIEAAREKLPALASTPTDAGSLRAAHFLYDTGVIVIYSDGRALPLKKPTVMELPSGVKIMPTGEVVGASGYQLGYMKRGDALTVGSGGAIDWQHATGATLSGGLVASGQIAPGTGPLSGPAAKLLASLYGTGSIPENKWIRSDESVSVSAYRPYSNKVLSSALKEGKRVVILVGTGGCEACNALRTDALRKASNIPANTVVLDLAVDPTGGASTKFGVKEYPAAILLNPQGNPEKTQTGAKTLNDLIANLLLVK